MMSKKNIVSKEVNFEIPAPDIRSMEVTIVGTAPLIFHKWSEKAMKMMLNKQMKTADAGKREAKDPQKDYEESFYYNKEKKIAFPALSIKQAMVDSARNIEGLTMTLLRGAIFVMGDEDGLIPVVFKEKRMRQDMVRVGMGTADIRFRGEVRDWSMTFLLKWNNAIFSAVQVLNLLQTAGFASGLGEWRPSRNGDFGTFEVKKG